MCRPQIIKPETKKIMSIYSAEFMDLLDKGYPEDDLLATRLPVSPNIPLTYIPDIDLVILEQQLKNAKDARDFCEINNYTNTLCHRRDFWLKQIHDHHLTIPSFVDMDNVNFMNLFYTLRWMGPKWENMKHDKDDYRFQLKVKTYQVNVIFNMDPFYFDFFDVVKEKEQPLMFKVAFYEKMNYGSKEHLQKIYTYDDMIYILYQLAYLSYI